ncbi:CUB and sushi domain-containing protein 1 [Orchesella cincta]|uniref:CUB and sushi domain-containing protein 1 n=1 Tax=Orchesella cincta TaxID=48709 RepID=A0A1D2MA06_ORCCI|nr:CUB and sushi domain-containing protein 1 [Orchesella cincta]
MKGISTLLLTFGLMSMLALVSASTKDGKEPRELASRYLSPHFQTYNDSSVQCGEVLNATSGGISYKAFELIEPNERCVWVIRGGNTDGFRVNVLYLGFSYDPNGTQIVASCLRHYFEAYHEILNQTGPEPHLGICNVLMITFATGPNVKDSTGFVLQYEALGGGVVSPRSTDHLISTGEPGIMKYPETPGQYDDNEFSTFVFEPSNNIYSPGKRINLIYLKGLMESHFDYLRVYTFNSTSTELEKWEYKGVINDDNTETELIFNQDLILIEFHSDRNNPGTGFQIVYTTSGVEGCQVQ